MAKAKVKAKTKAPKAATWNEYEDAFKALNAIEGQFGLAAVRAQAFDVGGLCKQYGAIRGYIETALKFLEWLPHGETIRKVIGILMELADRYCGVGPQAAGAAAPAKPAALTGEQAFAEIEKALASKAPAAPPTALATGFGGDVCDEYHRIKPYIEPALEVVEWLPYGSTIVKVVRLLMRLADSVC